MATISLQYEDEVYNSPCGGDRIASVTDSVTPGRSHILTAVAVQWRPEKTLPDSTVLHYTYNVNCATYLSWKLHVCEALPKR